MSLILARLLTHVMLQADWRRKCTCLNEKRVAKVKCFENIYRSMNFIQITLQTTNSQTYYPMSAKKKCWRYFTSHDLHCSVRVQIHRQSGNLKVWQSNGRTKQPIDGGGEGAGDASKEEVASTCQWLQVLPKSRLASPRGIVAPDSKDLKILGLSRPKGLLDLSAHWEGTILTGTLLTPRLFYFLTFRIFAFVSPLPSTFCIYFQRALHCCLQPSIQPNPRRIQASIHPLLNIKEWV